MQSFVNERCNGVLSGLGDAADLYDAAMTVWLNSRHVVPLSVHTLVCEEIVADSELALRPLIEFPDLEW